MPGSATPHGSPFDQFPTGVPGLDRLTRGGLRRSGLHVVLGRAGAGKSILAHQIGSRHLRDGGTVLYLTALVETHQTLITQARTMRFFDPTTVSHGFYYASLYPAIERGGLAEMAVEIRRLLREREPTLLIIDGLHALKLAATSELDYQRLVHELEAQATVTGMTTIILTHPRPDAESDPTFTIADCVITLCTERLNLRSIRLLEVEKLRGVDIIGGQHTMEITADGVRVYPRIEALVAAEGLPDQVPALVRYELAAEGLTEMMGGGLPGSTCTFVIGTPGSGKTFLGLAFVVGGLEREEPALYFGFHETPDRLLLKADGIGLPLRRAVERGVVQLHWRPPSELLSDAIAEEILRLVDERGVKRLVIDGYEQLNRGAMLGDRAVPFFSAFCDVLKARGVTTLWTQDMRRIAGESFDLPLGDSQIVDSIIHVRSTEIQAEFRRLIAVLKVREQDYDRSIREFSIDTQGIRVGEVFRVGEALLTGLPQLSRDVRE